jgi:hypothetical protein
MVDALPVIPPAPIGNEQSADIPPSDNRWKTRPLTKQCALNRRIAIWSPPKFPAYNSNHALLHTFEKWPNGMTPSPDTLSRAGFYFTGKDMI